MDTANAFKCNIQFQNRLNPPSWHRSKVVSFYCQETCLCLIELRSLSSDTASIKFAFEWYSEMHKCEYKTAWLTKCLEECGISCRMLFRVQVAVFLGWIWYTRRFWVSSKSAIKSDWLTKVTFVTFGFSIVYIFVCHEKFSKQLNDGQNIKNCRRWMRRNEKCREVDYLENNKQSIYRLSSIPERIIGNIIKYVRSRKFWSAPIQTQSHPSADLFREILLSSFVATWRDRLMVSFEPV